jgi:phosphoribosylaminoimidazolecarboxamide formyltransferase/IMP cyclohydrolase
LTFKFFTKTNPTPEQIEDAIFAWKVCKYAKSNAIVIAKDFKTLAIGQGQTNRVGAFEWALNYACDGSKDAVAASDGFFPAVDNIQAAAQGRIALLIQPGGSIKDADVIAEANKYKIAMITTGIRHFRH